ncbi:MAG: hypothetical protein OM95_14150 [Bdellovibrio sp. ArHS]|uniref:delta-60 repeat domain-containing protein n=1 Tax=Bdellovibrio sp. ArHS TaxID=1569284 RepID=UPI000583ACA7|nr:delta-60 repeat domain-containing protein [Bdellovibrio sp. ArHS]KHD87506.1 MAG: hypothetical protein OM95_14150 [Bdellovibrio sp. ArHS]
MVKILFGAFLLLQVFALTACQMDLNIADLNPLENASTPPPSSFQGTLKKQNAVSFYEDFDASEEASSVILLANNKYLVAGLLYNKPAVWMYNADFSINTGFARDGFLYLALESGKSYERITLFEDSNNKILVILNTSPVETGNNSTRYLYRLNLDGSLDSSFGNGGQLVLETNTLVRRTSFILQSSSGYYFVNTDSTGTQLTPSSWSFDWRASVSHLLYDGSSDASFGSGGTYTLPLPPAAATYKFQSPGRAALDSNGDLYIATTISQDGSDAGYIYKVLPSGSVDATWGTAGIVSEIQSFPNRISFSGVFIYNSKLYVSAIKSHPDDDFRVYRYDIDGTLDTTFNGTGYYNFANVSGASGAYDGGSIAGFDSSGNIYVQGQSTESGVPTISLFVARLTSGGALDISYGNSGFNLYATGITNYGGMTRTSLVKSDGSIMAFYETYHEVMGDNLFNLVTAKILPTGNLDNTYGTLGLKEDDEVRSYLTDLKENAQEILNDTEGNFYSVSSFFGAHSGDIVRISKYLSAGSVDSAFGSSGVLKIPHFALGGVAIQDDKLYVSGYDYDVVTKNFALTIYGYNTDGTVNSSFGVAGKAVVPLGGYHVISHFPSVASIFHSDGSLTVSTVVADTNDDAFTALWRLNALGQAVANPSTLQNITIVGPCDSYQKSLLVGVPATDQFYVLGPDSNNMNENSLYLYNQDFSKVTSFGSAGERALSGLGADIPDYSFLQGAFFFKGALYLTIYLVDADSEVMALAKLDSDGSLNTNFGNSGTLTFAHDLSYAGYEWAQFMPNESEEEIVVISFNGQGDPSTLQMISADGVTLDTPINLATSQSDTYLDKCSFSSQSGALCTEFDAQAGSFKINLYK